MNREQLVEFEAAVLTAVERGEVTTASDIVLEAATDSWARGHVETFSEHVRDRLAGRLAELYAADGAPEEQERVVAVHALMSSGRADDLKASDHMSAVRQRLLDAETEPRWVSSEIRRLAWLELLSGRDIPVPLGATIRRYASDGASHGKLREVSRLLVHTAPMSHFGGSVGSAYTLRGAAAVTLRRFDPVETLRAVERYRATAVPLVPTMLKDLTAAAASGSFDLGSLRALPYGGSAIGAAAAAHAHQVFGEVLYQFYGLSEALAPVAVLSARDHRHEPGRPPPPRLASAGRFCPSVEFRVLPGAGRPDGAGELQVRGVPVMEGYWNAPDQTAAVLREGWFTTGDIGFVDDGGFLHIVDRSRDVIISGGFNIYPGEVERVIESLDGVQAAAVVGVPHPRWGEAVAAVVVTKAGHRVEAADIVGVCRQNLAGFKKPVHVTFADRLPLTGTGKVSRREVRERHWPAGHSAAPAADRGPGAAPTAARDQPSAGT